MDGRQTELSNEEPRVLQKDTQRRRRKKAISTPSHNSMDQISVEFVVPITARGGNSSNILLLDVGGNWTVEQVS